MTEDIKKYKRDSKENRSFADLLILLSNQINVILLVPIIFCSISIFYALFIADIVYVSTSKIMSSSSSNMTKAAGLAAQFGLSIPIGGDNETKWVYPEVIKSRTFNRKLLKRSYDTKKFGKQKSLTQILTYGNKQPDTSLDTLETEALDILKDMIQISENLKTGVFTLTTKAIESKLSADLNKAILEELDEHQKKHNREKTGKTREFIEERIVETEKDLNKVENNLKNFMDRNRRIENSPLLLLEQQRLNREVSVLTGVFTTLKQQLETTKIEEMREADYVIIVDPPEAPIIRAEPKRKRIVLTAGVLGVFLGLITALVFDLIGSVGSIERGKFQVAKRALIKNIKLIVSTPLNIFKK